MMKTAFLSGAKDEFLFAAYFERLGFLDVPWPWDKLSCVHGATLATCHYPYDLRSKRN